jgi:Lon protease-like protein
MTDRPFHPRLEDLPRILPIFPLPGTLLLPTGKLPLNIFEPRYLAMVGDCLAWGRILGMIQPSGPPVGGDEPPIFETGCAGRVSTFSETEDGRLMITLTGVCRFHVSEELTAPRGYRRVVADWAPFAADLGDAPEFSFDRKRLLEALKPYLKLHNMELNWRAIESASDHALTTSLCMSCPFEPREKQALLECQDPARRAQTLTALVEMAIAEGPRGGGHLRQ